MVENSEGNARFGIYSSADEGVGEVDLARCPHSRRTHCGHEPSHLIIAAGVALLLTCYVIADPVRRCLPHQAMAV